MGVVGYGFGRDDKRSTRAKILQVVRAQGCVCDPEIDATEDMRQPGLHSVAVRHDEWCPLLHRVESATERRN